MHFEKFAAASQPRASRNAISMAAVTLVAGLVCGSAAAQQYAAGRILAMPRVGLPEAALDKIVKEQGGSKARRVGRSELRIIDVPPGLEKQMIDRLRHHPHFKFAELDQKAEAAFVPNDPYFGSQWHTTKINAPAAWDRATGAGVTIGIIDTGVDATQPDLKNQLVAGYNFYDNNTNTSPVNGHGTWVSGTVAATINNATGVAAVAGEAKIMPLRVVDSSGVGYWSAIASAITYAADHGARVVNASFENLLASSSILSAAAYMKSKNGLVVVAAGNSGADPGLTPNSSVIAVSATDSNDARCSFSSYGSYVAMSAPGTPIWTTDLGGGYTQGTGTSFSSPIVAGTIALMMSANPQLSNAEIEKLLYATAVDLGAAGRDPYFGYGRVDTGGAVNAAADATSTSDTQPPNAAVSSPAGGTTVGGLVAVNASASDNVGVTKVELWVNGAFVGVDTSSPYAFSWDSTKSANGTAKLQVAAYDAAGNTASSAAVSVSVSNTVNADVTPPAVTMTSPAEGSSYRANSRITITASATDDSGSAGLRQALYIDGSLKSTSNGGALSYSWKPNRRSTGVHSIQVVATDAAGNSATVSRSVTVQ